MSGKDLRIVFMGTPDFAVASLKVLVEGGYNIVGVITAPDKPAGRGQQMNETAVKKYALSKGIPVLQPEKLKSHEFVAELQELQADLQVVVAFRMLPEVVWDMPRLGTFNLHASLLPKYRGAAPLNWAVINGETESGVTSFKLQHEIDTGNIMFQEKVAIGPDDTVEILHDKLMEVGAGVVVKTVDALADGTVSFVPQDELISKGFQPTPAPKIFKETCLVNWDQDAQAIKNLVRGLSPYPSAWTRLINTSTGIETTAKLFSVEISDDLSEAQTGTICSDGKNFMKVKSSTNWVLVNELQLAGKKRMGIQEFLRGFQQIGNFKAE